MQHSDRRRGMRRWRSNPVSQLVFVVFSVYFITQFYYAKTDPLSNIEYPNFVAREHVQTNSSIGPSSDETAMFFNEKVLLSEKEAETVNQQLLSLMSLESNMTQWVESHPYTQFLKRNEVKHERFLIVSPYQGFGNTVSVLIYMLQLGLLMKRKVLLISDENSQTFFDCPLGEGNCWISADDPMITGDSKVLVVTQGSCSNYGQLVTKNSGAVLRAILRFPARLGACIQPMRSDPKFSTFAKRFDLMVKGLPKHSQYFGSFEPLFFSMPKKVLLDAVEEYKRGSGFEKFNHSVVLNIRTCRDCPKQFKLLDSDVEQVLKCSEAVFDLISEEFNVSRDSTFIHLTTDFQSKMIGVLQDSPIAQRGDLHWSLSDKFVHTANTKKSMSRDKSYLATFVDWMMFADSDFCIITGSTFATTGTFRKGYGDMKKLFMHSSMIGDVFCRGHGRDEAVVPDDAQVANKWLEYFTV